MKRLWTCLIALLFATPPVLGVAQQLPRNLSCQDLLDTASGRLSRSNDGGKTYVPIPRPRPVDIFGQVLLSYDTALCGRLSRREISVDEFNALHAAMVQGLSVERQKLTAELARLRQEQERERQRQALERQRLATQQQAIQAQREATQATRELAEAQRQTTQAQYDNLKVYNAWQQYWANWAQNYQRNMRNPIQCQGTHLGGGMFTVNCN